MKSVISAKSLRLVRFSPQRMLQMSQLSAYMLTEHVPLQLKSICPIVSWFRLDTASQNHLIILFNPGFDPAEYVEVWAIAVICLNKKC